jgi:hypothetical protein
VLQTVLLLTTAFNSTLTVTTDALPLRTSCDLISHGSLEGPSGPSFFI